VSQSKKQEADHRVRDDRLFARGVLGGASAALMVRMQALLRTYQGPGLITKRNHGNEAISDHPVILCKVPMIKPAMAEYT
jgi:hypothetical protein